jgi:hypothetical protein
MIYFIGVLCSLLLLILIVPQKSRRKSLDRFREPKNE